jgi:glutamyl-tRNA synthetase
VPEADHPDAPFVVRLKAPRDGETVIEDAVQGTVTFRNDQLDDMILLRSDGTPTYMLAVVVDDHDMGVTHAIRGDDHLNNAARQAQIYRAMGWAEPVWAHIPLIHGPDGKKLSKRHGATGVMEYAEMGYPAAAMRNYLARLGWSHGDDELFTDARRWTGSTSGHRQIPGTARHEEAGQRRGLAHRADGGRDLGAGGHRLSAP